MNDHVENGSFDVAQSDRILARTLAAELTEEARLAKDENTTLISCGSEESEEN